MAHAGETAEDLQDVALSGAISESTIKALFDVSNVNLPLLDRIGRGTANHPEHSWMQDRLNTPAANSVADGEQAVSAVTGNQRRVWNFCNIAAHRFITSERAIAVDPIGYANNLAKGVRDRSLEVMRDFELMLTANNASVVNSGDTAGEMWGLEAFLDDEDHAGNTVADKRVQNGTGTSVAGGGWENVNTTTKVVPAYTYNTWTAAGLNLSDIETVANAIWDLGGNPTLLTSRSRMVREISKFMFDSANAKIATLQSDQGVPGGGGDMAGLTAIQSVSVFITNFGITMSLVPSRIQGYADTTTNNSTTVFIGDPQMLSLDVLKPLSVSEIGKTGLTEQREVSIDATLAVKSSDSWGMIMGNLETTAVTA